MRNAILNRSQGNGLHPSNPVGRFIVKLLIIKLFVVDFKLFRKTSFQGVIGFFGKTFDFICVSQLYDSSKKH